MQGCVAKKIFYQLASIERGYELLVCVIENCIDENMQLDVTNQDLIDMRGTENMGKTMYCPFQEDHHFNELNFQKQFKAFAIRLTKTYKKRHT